MTTPLSLPVFPAAPGRKSCPVLVPLFRRLLVAMLLLWVAPAEAVGQVPRKVDLRAAKEHFRQAELHYRRSNFALALEQFKEALKYARRPSIILNIAQCYRQLGDGSRALLYYRLYLSEWQVAHPRSEPKFKTEVERHIQALAKQQGESAAEPEPRELQPDPPAPPTEPAVTLDEEIVPEELDDGAVAPSSAPTTGQLFVFASPDGAVVRVGERTVGTISGGELELALPPGRHELRVEAPGYTPWRGNLSVALGRHRRLEVELPPAPPEPNLGWFIAGITTSTIALAAEITALVYTARANNEFKQSTRFRRFKDGAIASHIVAASFAVTTAVCWWLYSRGFVTPEQPNARISLLPTAGGAVAGASLAF